METQPNIAVLKDGDVVRIELHDPDFAGEPYIYQLRKRLRVVFEHVERPLIVLNLAKIRYISSAAIGELMSVKRKLASMGGQIHLASPTPEVNDIIQITRIDKAIPVYASLEEAKRQFQRPAASTE